MKRHVSLILALEMVFSAFFAFPVAAAEAEPSMREEFEVSSRAEAVCECGDDHCEAELRAVGAADARVGASGEEINYKVCKHTYATAPVNGSQHKRYCTKCGYTYYVSHSFKYTIQSANYHRMYCSCGYSVSCAHTYGYVNTGNTHTKYCKLCGYGAGSESHVYPSKWTCDNGSTHSKTCSICGFSLVQPHVLDRQIVSDLGTVMYYEKCTSPGCSHYIYKPYVEVVYP